MPIKILSCLFILFHYNVRSLLPFLFFRVPGPNPAQSADCISVGVEPCSHHASESNGGVRRSAARALEEVPASADSAQRATRSRAAAVAGAAPAPAPEAPPPIPPRSLELTEEVLRQMRAEDFCVNTCQWAVDRLRKAMTLRVHGWAPTQPMDVRKGWLDDLERAAGRVAPAKSTVVVVGDTGAGKSSLLNALLDETSLLPTNGMRACTGRPPRPPRSPRPPAPPARPLQRPVRSGPGRAALQGTEGRPGRHPGRSARRPRAGVYPRLTRRPLAAAVIRGSPAPLRAERALRRRKGRRPRLVGVTASGGAARRPPPAGTLRRTSDPCGVPGIGPGDA